MQMGGDLISSARTTVSFALAAVATASASATLRDWATLMVARSIGAPPVGDGTRAAGTVGTAASTVSAGTLTVQPGTSRGLHAQRVGSELPTRSLVRRHGGETEKGGRCSAMTLPPQ